MSDIPGAGLIGLLAGLALNALVRWSERPRSEPTEPVEKFDPWMFTSTMGGVDESIPTRGHLTRQQQDLTASPDPKT